MPYTPTAPDPEAAIADLIREHRRVGTNFYTSHEIVGSFATMGGATVEVRALAKFGLKNYQSTERQVQIGASAHCSGHGCVSPEHEQPFIDQVSVNEAADKTAESAGPLIQAAREWAQTHAEKCRAQPYTDR
jgi:hypothetical protein